MKKFPKIVITFFLILFFTNNLIAQFATIDSLKIIPSNPTVSDTIKVICFATFTSGGCSLTSSWLTESEGLIKMYASHSVGILTVICHSTDTLKTGNLGAGKYEMIYSLMANSVTYDIDTIDFDVQQFVGIAFQDRSDKKSEIYPIPATGKITISTNWPLPGETTITVFSFSGQQMMQARFQNQKQFEMDVSALSKGIYLVKIQRNTGVETKKLVVQ